MRIALDTNALYATQAGTARYVRGLIKGLRRVNAADVQVSELAWPVENFEYRQPERALKTFYRELVWAPWIGPRRIAKQKAGLFHSTAPVCITPPVGIRHVATLHDLALIRQPERFRRWHRSSGRRYLERLHRVDRIICISRFTADEAMQLLGLPPERLEVVYNGCEFHPDEDAPVEESPDFHVPDEFFLFVGSLEPGKNLTLLRQVYALAQGQNVRLPPLVIVGARWSGVETEGAPPAGWHYAGRQSDAALVHLYRRALALVFPSKYEGFGFPVVEAMALKCPVICSRVASLPEVGGDAALYAEMNPRAYLDVMLRLKTEPGLRDETLAKGEDQASRFSWRKCARETVEVYRQTLEP